MSYFIDVCYCRGDWIYFADHDLNICYDFCASVIILPKEGMREDLEILFS